MRFFSQKVTSQVTLFEENLQKDTILSEHETNSYQKENYPPPSKTKNTKKQPNSKQTKKNALGMIRFKCIRHVREGAGHSYFKAEDYS